MPATYLTGDALHTLTTLPTDTYDAMLTDPPYGIAFMGKAWDRGVPSADVWAEALRVLKPGAFALVACGTRTQHRMVSNLEAAGFEVRDVIAWLYGSGFPKSHDVSKGIDRAAGAERAVVGVAADRALDGARRQVDGSHAAPHAIQGGHGYGDRWSAPITTPATPDAERWQGYGTALKPAMELWTLVRKPPQGTVAANALQHGTGALNIDGCRVLSVDVPQPFGTPTKSVGGIMNKSPEMRGEPYEAHAAGRWPANVIHDGSDEVLAGFPETTSGTVNPYEKATRQGNAYGKQPAISTFPREGDTGSAARFYYTAKASRAEREEGLHHLPMHEHVGTMKGDADGTLQTGAGNPHDTTARNPHPTVKPLALTQYLATLLLPPPRPDATPRRILTPYSGVGSEVIGALLAGWDDATGIELDPTYADIARARTAHWIMRAHGPLFADI